MGDFGYKIKGSTTSNILDRIAGTKYALTEDGIGESITAFIGSTLSLHGKCALYDSSRNLVANGVTEEKALDPLNDWVTFNFVGTKPELPAGDYIIVAWVHALGSVNLYRDADVAYDRWWESHAYNNFPASLAASDRTGKFSIYCTYSLAVKKAKPASIVPLMRVMDLI